jgi:hypothetical protein
MAVAESRRQVELTRLLRYTAPALYAAVLAYVVYRDGIPAARERLLMWIVLGLLAVSITNVRGWARSVVLEWLPFALILWAYDILRGQADGLLFETHVRPQLEADRVLGLGTAPTVWLQEHLWHGALDLRWWDYAAWGVYVSYFLATYLLAGFLWFSARDRFRRYVAAVSLLALMGFATYALFPAAPPWMASSLGELEPTTRTIGIVAGQLPWLDFSTLFERGAEYANPVAAVPSLHGAYTLLFAITLWPIVPRWVRPALALYPPAMAFALAYTAEHYLVDVVIGWAYTVVAVWVVARVADALSARREESGIQARS